MLSYLIAILYSIVVGISLIRFYFAILKWFFMRSPSRYMAAAQGQGIRCSRFRRQRIVLIGCGDVGTRWLQLLRAVPQRNIIILSRQPQRLAALRTQGVRVLQGDLDDVRTLYRLSGLAHRIVHLAPPAAFASNSQYDYRTRNLVQALRTRTAPQHIVYVSTSGIYGDYAGAWVDETAHPKPNTARAHRRLDAEKHLRSWACAPVENRRTPSVHILRAPGIYASSRWVAGMQQRLLNRRAVLQANDDIYTNRIHIDDLARACHLALWRGAAQRTYNINDDAQLKMADFYDLAAQTYQLPKPPRISYAQAKQQLPAGTLSFMQASRRLNNQRMRYELGLRLHYSHPAQGLQRTICNTTPHPPE